jgi:hypothetical protein
MPNEELIESKIDQDWPGFKVGLIVNDQSRFSIRVAPIFNLISGLNA